jgi:hypothetical protein
MKPFKIKRREHRQSYFIIGPSKGSYPKPQLPLIFVKCIHEFGIYKKPQFIIETSDRQIKEINFANAMSSEASDMLNATISQVAEYLEKVKQS